MEPKTREEALLANIAGGEYNITPLTEKEKILVNLAGGEYDVAPSTREEFFLNEAAKSISGGGGGGNPNRVEVIQGTLANPFGDVDIVDLFDKMLNGNASANVEIDASALGLGIFPPVLIGVDNYFYCVGLSSSSVSTIGESFLINWSRVTGSLDFAAMWPQGGGEGTDMSPYASLVSTTLTIIWHPLPEN